VADAPGLDLETWERSSFQARCRAPIFPVSPAWPAFDYPGRHFSARSNSTELLTFDLVIYVTDRVSMSSLPFSHGIQTERFAPESPSLRRYANIPWEVVAVGVQTVNAFKVIRRVVAAGGAVDVR